MKYFYHFVLLLLVTLPSFVYAIDPPVITAGTQLCAPAGGSVTLTATAPGGGTFKWYTTQTGGTEIATGPTFTTPVLTVNTTYYAEVTQNNETSSRKPYDVVINTPPIASFTAPTAVNCASQAYSFTNGSTGNNLTYAWNFGNPASGTTNTSTQQSPSHVFIPNPGTGIQQFTVTLTVTDSVTGCSATSTQSVNVQQTPDAAFDVSSGSAFYTQEGIFINCDATLTSPSFVFSITNGSTTAASNTNYTINWGDGTTDNLGTAFTNVSHTYNNLGFFNITLSVQNNITNCTSTKIYQFFNGNSPGGNLGGIANTTGCAPYSLTWPVENTQDNTPGTTYTFTVNDDSPPQTFTQENLPSTITHNFTKSSCDLAGGKYTVTLTINNPCSSIAPTTQVQASLKAEADFSVSQNSVCTNVPATFTNTSIGNYFVGNNCSTNFNKAWTITPATGWTLTSGQLAGTETIGVQFNTPGTYTVTLGISRPGTNNSCTEDSITKTICVKAPLTAPVFTLSNNQGCTPLNVTATSPTVANQCNSPITYAWAVTYTNTNCGTTGTPSWNYANGTSATSVNPQFNFVTPGTYSIRLTMNNGCGNVQSAIQTVTVKSPPTVTIAAISSICGGASASISPTATVIDCGATPLTYAWSFPGGVPAASTTAVPGAIVYNTPGSYTVTLAVTNECGTTTRTQNFSVSPAVAADAGADVTICNGSTNLAGSGSGGNGGAFTYSWSPATGLSNAAIATPVATPTATTTYTLTVTNGGCTATDQVTVYVNNVTPGTIAANQVLCTGTDPAAFTVITSATGQGTLTYQWESSVTNDTTGYSNIAGATSDTYDAPVLTQQTWFRRTVTSTLNGVPCPVTSNVLSITINTITAGSISGDQTICPGGDPTAFGSVAATANGTISYQWQSSPDNSTFTNIPGAISAIYNPPVLTANTWYRRLDTSTLNTVACSDYTNTVAITLTAPPTITSQPLATQTLCAAATAQVLTVMATGGTTPYTYQWYSNTTNNTTGGTAIGGATSDSFTPSATTVGTLYYYCVVSSPEAGCTDTSTVAQVIVIAAPAISSQPQTQTLCEGQTPTLLTVAYQNGTGTPTFQWYSNTTSSTIGATVLTGATAASYQPAATLGVNYYYVIITFPSGGCNNITSDPAAITVNSLPVVTTAEAQTICSGESFDVTPTNGNGNILPAGTLYKWTAPTGTGFTGGSAQTTPTAAISQTLTNTTNTVVTATYTVTPVSNGCDGTPFQAVVTINPKPVLPAQAKSICSGDTFTVPPITGSSIVPAGTTYSWPISVVTGGITGATAGTASSDVSGTLVNPTNIPQTATYTVTPLSPTGNCIGDDFTITVTVNPRPAITAMSGSACSGTAFTFTPVNGTDGLVPSDTQYTWAAPAPQTGITGLTSGSGNSVTGNLTNTTAVAVTIQYVVTPTSGSCAGNTFIVDVLINPTPTVADIADQTVCNGSAITAINYTGTVTGTQFNWTNNTPAIGLAASGTGDIPTFDAINTGTVPITATITVTPVVNGCNGSPKTFTITVNPAPVVVFSATDQAICSGTASTAVTLTSATPNTTISWTAVAPSGITGVQTSGTTTIPIQTLVNTTSSPITITYTAVAATADASACPGAPSIYTITVNPVPFVNTTQQTVVCSGVPLNFMPADGSGNNIPTGTTFTWSAPTGTGFTGGSAQITAQPSLNQTLINTTIDPVVATYTLTPQFGGCTGVPFTIQVTINPAAVIPNASIVLCSGDSFTYNPAPTATLFPAGTVFNWSVPSGNVNGGTSGTGEILISGVLTNATSTVQNAIYTITPVSPTGNCAGNPFTLTVAVNANFAVNSTVSNYNGFQISSAGANDGFINLTPSGGSGSYTYIWTGPGTFSSTSQNVSNLAQGNYSVTINDGLCPAITLQFQITEPLPLIIEEVVASHVNVDCFGQSTGVIEVAVTQASIAPFDYALLLADGTIVENVLDSTALNYIFDNLAAGIYDIRVTDANGTMKFINGIAITQPPTGLAISNAVVSDFNGFSISCNGAHNGSINLTVTGGYPEYTYSWTGPAFTASTKDISNLSPGVYTVVINDTTNSCPITESYTITEPQPVAFSGIISDFNGFGISCFDGNNGSITITPTGGTSEYTYAWTGPGTFTATMQNLTGLQAGTYQLNLTDSNGCVAAVQSFTLTQPSALTISEQHTNILCFGDATGAIDITVGGGLPHSSGAYTYAWTGPNGFASVSEDLTTVAAGTYNLVATDSNGCTISLAVTLTQQPEIIIIPTTTPISCYGANDASITLAITGGSPPYTAQWSNLATGIFQDNLAAGNYVITVTDGSNCVRQVTVVIPEAPVFTVNPVFNHVSCNGAQDGSITLNLVGGIAPVSLVWSDGSTAGTQRNNLGPGTYTVTITDGKPCQIVRTFTIVEPAKLTVGANITHALDCNDTMSGAIDLLVAGGMPPYSYTWSNGASTEDLIAITSGTYLVTVKDANNCTASGTYVITRPQPITLNVTSNVNFNCDTKQVTQVNTAQASGGVPPFQYTWSSGNVSGNSGQSMTTNQNGTVIVTATDASGCTATQSFIVDTQFLGNVAFTATSYASVTYNVISIFDPVQFENHSTGDYTDLAWDFGDGAVSGEENPTHTYAKEGTYTVTLTIVYPYGCVDVEKLTLIVTKGYDVMIPNAFTPNGDGTNDTFNAVHKGLKSITLNIYDTWGSVIYYEKGDVIRGWDGTIKGVASENGNYYYRIEAETFYGQTVSYEGPVVLIK